MGAGGSRGSGGTACSGVDTGGTRGVPANGGPPAVTGRARKHPDRARVSRVALGTPRRTGCHTAARAASALMKDTVKASLRLSAALAALSTLVTLAACGRQPTTM